MYCHVRHIGIEPMALGLGAQDVTITPITQLYFEAKFELESKISDYKTDVISSYNYSAVFVPYKDIESF